jgi:hypothetical protein
MDLKLTNNNIVLPGYVQNCYYTETIDSWCNCKKSGCKERKKNMYITRNNIIRSFNNRDLDLLATTLNFIEVKNVSWFNLIEIHFEPDSFLNQETNISLQLSHVALLLIWVEGTEFLVEHYEDIEKIIECEKSYFYISHLIYSSGGYDLLKTLHDAIEFPINILKSDDTKYTEKFLLESTKKEDKKMLSAFLVSMVNLFIDGCYNKGRDITWRYSEGRYINGRYNTGQYMDVFGDIFKLYPDPFFYDEEYDFLVCRFVQFAEDVKIIEGFSDLVEDDFIIDFVRTELHYYTVYGNHTILNPIITTLKDIGWRDKYGTSIDEMNLTPY